MKAVLVIHGGAGANVNVHYVRNRERAACKFMRVSQMPASLRSLDMDKKFGTVGAVALHMLGNLTSANAFGCNASNQTCAV